MSENLRRVAAAAIANARGGRKGAPPVTNVLDILPDEILSPLLEDADAVLDAIGANELLALAQEVIRLDDEDAGLQANDGVDVVNLVNQARAAVAKARE